MAADRHGGAGSLITSQNNSSRRGRENPGVAGAAGPRTLLLKLSRTLKDLGTQGGYRYCDDPGTRASASPVAEVVKDSPGSTSSAGRTSGRLEAMTCLSGNFTVNDYRGRVSDTCLRAIHVARTRETRVYKLDVLTRRYSSMSGETTGPRAAVPVSPATQWGRGRTK